MPGCEACQDVCGHFPIWTGSDFSALLRVLRNKMEEGLMMEDPFLLEGPRRALQPPFSDVAGGSLLPDDMEYFFRCLACRQPFRLACQFLDGHGGGWDLFDERRAVRFDVIHP